MGRRQGVSQAMLAFLREFWWITAGMAPYLLFGFLVAGLLSVLISPETVERHLGGRRLWPVLKASLLGVPLPLCSCGVIPVAASLRRHGAGRGATTAFLLSTPQTGVDSIMVTLSLLGPVFAVFRPLAALVTGIVGGAAVTFFERGGKEADVPPPRCEEECCSVEAATGGRLMRALRHGFVTLPADIGKPLLVGLAIAGAIAVFVPGEDFFAAYLGTGFLSIVVMMLVGIPVYVCATASVPVAAVLIAKGISPGAALAFLIAGPATNAAALATIWKVLGRRTTVIFLATVAVAAVVAGTFINYIIPPTTVSAMLHTHEMLPEWAKTVAVIALLGVLAWALLRPWLARLCGAGRTEASPSSAAHEERSVRFRVTGMTCSHCATTVRRALLECPGVTSAEVDLATREAIVSGADFDLRGLRSAVEAVGYGVPQTDAEADRPGAKGGS